MNTSESIDLLEDLLEDERIVTAGEREFLADLLRHSESNPQESNLTLTQAIAKIAGEIVVQRAGSLMADSILRKLTYTSTYISGGGGAPRPPGPNPPNPGPPPGGKYRARSVSLTSLPPRPPGPNPPNPGPPPGGVRALGPKGILNLAVEERTESAPPRCVVLEEFLAPAELNDLLSYALSREKQFEISEIISPGVESRDTVDFEYRRSHVLFDLGQQYDRFVDRLQTTLPRFLSKLGMEPFPVSRVEAQITASQDGDFFRWHNDNGHKEVSASRITFVYFFHREPKAFEGGELRIQSPVTANSAFGSGNYYTIVPRQNQMVLFDSSLTHEIAPVKCPSGRFADSRFTVNGWVSR